MIGHHSKKSQKSLTKIFMSLTILSLNNILQNISLSLSNSKFKIQSYHSNLVERIQIPIILTKLFCIILKFPILSDTLLDFCLSLLKKKKHLTAIFKFNIANGSAKVTAGSRATTPGLKGIGKV